MTDDCNEKYRNQLERLGYSYNETMRMVGLRHQGKNVSQIAKIFGTSRHTVRHQLEAFEKVTGERLPGHKK